MEKEVFQKKSLLEGTKNSIPWLVFLVCLFGFLAYGMKRGEKKPPIIGELKNWTAAQSARRHLI